MTNMRKRTVCAVVLIGLMAFASSVATAQEPTVPKSQSGAHQEFLKQFVGEWECEVEAYMEPGQPPVKSTGKMAGHMIGDFWAVVVIHGDAMGMPFQGQATFGFDATDKHQYIGTWVDSMSDFMWHYEGRVDGNKLILDSEGRNPADPGTMLKARDTWDFQSADRVVLTGEMEGPDGQMMKIMEAVCTRAKSN